MTYGEKTLVGVPFYEKEGNDCLDITLQNIDSCLNNLGVDASILVWVNGPETSQGQPPSFNIKQSQYNADITVINSQKLGQTRAIDDIMDDASNRGIGRVFITDADIYRFPDSLKEMWKHPDTSVVGAHYRPSTLLR